MSDHPQTSQASEKGSTEESAKECVGAGRAWRLGAMAAAVTLLAAATAACSSGGSPGGSAASTPASSPTVSSGRTGGTSSGPPSPTASLRSATPATPPTSGRSTPAAPARCTADQLVPSIGPADVGAGNIRYELRLTNTGQGACTLRGFPGVSLLAGDGATIGKPATREGGELSVVKLAPGAAAQVTLHTLNKGIKGTACWPAPSLLRIFPPGSKDALTLRTPVPVVCGDTFTVTAVQPA
ncbi:DUF4232 domain-containing protein [Streptomyces sp. NPDC051569]|uniref:DUF4232 domain-containing protein n=1 Tax=Streptomyces sp. NPDC051569 TaxID=3365661 RepID=UPI0037B0A55B